MRNGKMTAIAIVLVAVLAAMVFGLKFMVPPHGEGVRLAAGALACGAAAGAALSFGAYRLKKPMAAGVCAIAALAVWLAMPGDIAAASAVLGAGLACAAASVPYIANSLSHGEWL